MKGPRILRIATDIIRFCAIVGGLGLIFAWLGVYDTGALPFYKSFIFWSTTMAVGAGASLLVAPFVWGRRFEEVGAIFKIAAASVIISVPVTLVLVFMFNSPREFSPTYLAAQFSYVLVISMIVTTAAYVRDIIVNKASDTAQDHDPVTAFLERLPLKYRNAALYAISSEDHYLRVHTSLGEELILMRLADAVRELAGAEGLQVHRSWWVATAAIHDERRVDGRSLLVLTNGTEVPVSRSYRADAKEAGLLR